MTAIPDELTVHAVKEPGLASAAQRRVYAILDSKMRLDGPHFLLTDDEGAFTVVSASACGPCPLWACTVPGCKDNPIKTCSECGTVGKTYGWPSDSYSDTPLCRVCYGKRQASGDGGDE